MFTYQHFIFGALFTVILFFIYPPISLIGLGIIFLSNIFIDIDHYFYYAYKKKDLNIFKIRRAAVKDLKQAYSIPREERNKIDSGIMALHGIEPLFIILILGFLVSHYFLFIFIGFAFHLILDILFDLTLTDRMIKASLIKDIIYTKSLHK